MLDDNLVETEVRPQEKRILRCPAEGCGKIFRSSPGYRYHLKSHASDPRPHQCRCCMKKFKSANGLKYHLRKSHSIEPVASKAKAIMAGQHNETSNGNEDSESTGDDDCVVPSLPPEQLISKHSPQQHESVLRMNHSITDYKTDQVFKSEPNLGYKGDHSLDYKSELLLNNNNDSNNNNYPRLGSYEENDNICYGSQAESSVRYGSYPGSSEMTIRYGAEGNASRYGGGDEMETVRLGSQSYSPKPSYRDFLREGFREGFRGDYHQRRTSVPDYYPQRSMVPQDRYPAVIGYSRADTPSRLGYPRFDIPARNFAMNRGEHAKTDNFHRVQNQYESRNDYQKSNETVFRSPGEFGSKRDYTVLKSGETVSRSPPTRNPFAPKSSSDEFVKPTYTRSDFGSRQNANESEFQHKVDKPVPMTLANGRYQQHDRRYPTGVAKLENAEKESMQEPPSINSQPKTDINGNSVVESSGILKRRSSKPIPPALVIEPPANSGEEKKDENCKLLPPEVNRLTEFAEFAISPHSPLVQSPFPLTLTPGLLGAGSTPDWMTKSFTRFFFPDKPPPYLNASGLNTSRHNQDEEEGEGRITTSSLPPSPFIDNVSTPQPFWTTQAWPTPVWHCFMKGCSIKFENKDEEFRRVEDIACCNSLLNKRNEEANYAVNGLTVAEIKEIKDIIMSSKGAKDRVVITFDSTTPGQQRLLVKCPVDHLFLVKHRGWSSPRPNEAMVRYGIPFRCLQKGDICIQSAQHKETNSNTLSPLVACSEAFPFGTCDNSAANTLSAMAKRQEMSVERAPPMSLMSTTSVSASSPAAESVSSTTTATYSPGDPFAKEVPYSMVIPTNESSISRHVNENNHQENKNLQPQAKKVKRKRKTNNLEEKQRRPMNGFMLFAKKMRIELTQKFPGKDNRAISKVLGEQWRALSTDERKDFATKAKVMADERRKINPDCWKRKRKKSKGGECEIEYDKIRIKKDKSAGSSSHAKGNSFSVV